jgi:YfiH family protein
VNEGGAALWGAAAARPEEREEPDAIPWQSELLSSIPRVAHGLTRRVEGLGRAHGNIGFSAPRDREDAWAMRQRWCATLDFVPENLVTLGQVHGRDVHIATKAHAGRGAKPAAGGPSAQIGLGDALVTNQIGPVLMTLHADCQPVLIVDPGAGRRGPAVGVAHAGWRGTVANIVGATLAVMASAFGTRAEDAHVLLGPAIGRCCYDVGDDVACAWREIAGADAGEALELDSQSPVTGGPLRHRFFLTAANALLLDRAGVRAANVETSAICTKCDGQHWFSHRGQGAHTGRFGAIIAIVGDGAIRG